MLQIMNSQQVHQIVSLSEKYGPQIAQQALTKVSRWLFSHHTASTWVMRGQTPLFERFDLHTMTSSNAINALCLYCYRKAGIYFLLKI